MVTITLKINEKTNIGKTFLAFLKTLTVKEKSIEVVKDRYNAQTEKDIAEARAGKGLIKAKNVEDLFNKLSA